jgi:hypothetical protein
VVIAKSLKRGTRVVTLVGVHFKENAATADIKYPVLTGLADEFKVAFRGGGAIVVGLRTATRT